jgi:hypothetical protein
MIVGLRSLINFYEGLRYSLVPKFIRAYKYVERQGINGFSVQQLDMGGLAPFI